MVRREQSIQGAPSRCLTYLPVRVLAGARPPRFSTLRCHEVERRYGFAFPASPGV